ncbi:MAG: FtsX-like permease family protein [Lentisphaeria bacterium]|nr:FtsX-like permease family protein [Lentisphaeria bacterium]
MIDLEIKKQPRLGLKRVIQLTVNGIKYRFFRSLVTMVVITVAIAFLMNSGVESLIKREVNQYSSEQIANERLAIFWLAKLKNAGTVDSHIEELSQLDKQSDKFKEFMAFAQVKDTIEIHQEIIKAANYLNFFNSMNYGNRRRLVQQATQSRIFDYLQPPEKQESFFATLSEIRSVSLPKEEEGIDPEESFKGFLGSWPSLKASIQKAILAKEQAILNLSQQHKDAELLELLLNNQGFLQDIRNAGFMISDADYQTVVEQSTDIANCRILEKSISGLKMKQRLASQFDQHPKDITTRFLWDEVFQSNDDVEWYITVAEEEQVLSKGQYTAETVVELAESKERFASLSESLKESRIKNSKNSFLGLGERMGWLLLVSLVVCGVGIANAMLMTVTERFREIATLKCLGALDSFIMTIFVLEAALLGTIGGIFGVILGLIIGVGRMNVALGNVVWTAMQPKELIIASLIAVVAGIVLAVLAAIYPALKASRLAPMEAMRIE